MTVYERAPTCVERWPECEEGAYHPNCCRFPKSCSCRVASQPIIVAKTEQGTFGYSIPYVGRQWGEGLWTAIDIIRASAQAEADRMARLMPTLERYGAHRAEHAPEAP